ncbi:YqaA family protein [Sulfurivermis fontis]|jgi:membrane protein YqaA with SNARE-associated domain|uniref:YqaA family protein n=1 Tax=Sulfurivermis fontis TaxID=1972068 RepID=UPI000FDCC3ED|nr:YqaA family protein [Sulfurivermis fontis]
MKLFSALYARVMRWAAHPHAPRYLATLSFAESSFFPIPPDVMLAPMALARRDRAWYYALLTTLASVVGGAAGYLIGYFAFELVEPLIREAGYWERYELAREWFDAWGFWAVFLAGFSPIPYKLFTISAGVIAMNVPLFMLASLIGRGARFFLVAGLMVWGGEPMERSLRLYIDRIGWVVILAAVAGYIIVSNG